MIYLLHGSDTYRSRQKLDEIIESYKKIHKSGLNFFVIDGETSGFDEFKKTAGSLSMFQEKKLIVLKEIFSDKIFLEKLKDYIEKENLAESKDVITVIHEAEIDNKNNHLSFFKKRAKTQEFEPLSGLGLRKWFWQELKDKKIEFEKEAAEKLLDAAGGDLWRISNELQRFKNFKPKEKILVKDVDLFIRREMQNDIFRSIDAIASRNKKLAVKLISNHLNNGESELYLLSMIEYQFRNLLKVKSQSTNDIPHRNKLDAGQVRMPRINELAKKLGMHPYVAQKSLEQAKKFTFDELKKIYEKLFELDLKIKTGQIEPRLGLEMLIIEICSPSGERN